jgi:hypothetical protein
MDMSIIALETLSIVLICGFLFASQLYITKILLKNVNILISNLDQNIAEALTTVIESKIGENFEAPNPIVMEFLNIFKQNMQNPAPIARNKDGTFKVIEQIE